MLTGNSVHTVINNRMSKCQNHLQTNTLYYTMVLDHWEHCSIRNIMYLYVDLPVSSRSEKIWR